MRRKAMENLIKWRSKSNRKPMIIHGARQVGKTWLMKEFGRQQYDKVVYVNFESNPRISQLFEHDMNVERIILGLEIESGFKIIPADTLIIFDEIQEAPKALTSLKYFNEQRPEYNILAAGSLLGVSIHQGTSFPVGKVEFMHLYPMDFMEFIYALGETSLHELLISADYQMISVFREKFIELLRLYYFIGGMPEVVSDYTENKDIKEVRANQKRILLAYEQDFSKHAPPKIVPRIRMLWNSLPGQLAKENKKFIYGQIRSGARAKDYELALTWLIDAGMINKVNRIKKPNIPLLAYEENSTFKLYTLDTGLLAAMCEIDFKTILEGNRLFTEFKGALSEQYVLQQLKTASESLVYYWTADKGTAEVDFIVSINGNIVPIEVKAEENLKAKSLKSYREKYRPELAIRTSMSDYRKEEWLTNIPLYCIGTIMR